MAKIQKTIQKPKLQNKPNYIRRIVRAVGMIIFAGIILVCLFPFLLLLLPFPAQENPAKNAAAIMPSFAKQNSLTEMYEENTPTGPGNITPWFVYTYQTNKSAEELSTLLKNYLKNAGYPINESPPSANNQSYMLQGSITKGNKLQEVSAIISTDTYFNYDPNNYGETGVPQGKTMLNITFSLKSQ